LIDGRIEYNGRAVGEVARINVAALRWKPGSLRTIDDTAFNVGTGKETSVNQLAQFLIQAAGGSADVRHGPARTGELMRSALSADRAGRELNWRPETAVADGLRRTYEWIKETVQ